jgi:hypothetical protein
MTGRNRDEMADFDADMEADEVAEEPRKVGRYIGNKREGFSYRGGKIKRRARASAKEGDR